MDRTKRIPLRGRRALTLTLVAALTLGLLQSCATGNALSADAIKRTSPLQMSRTPPMGWDPYNFAYRQPTEKLVHQQARAMHNNGMQNVGYTYVIVDVGWDLATRDANGNLQPDPHKFPHGIKPVVRYVHKLGLKFGIYSAIGPTNCEGSYAASAGHYQQDANLFASWGVDYIKLDQCTGAATGQTAETNYRAFGLAIMNAEHTYRHPMFYSISTNRPGAAPGQPWSPGTAQPWRWAPSITNPGGVSFRTGTDIRNHWIRFADGWYQGVFANFLVNSAPGMAQLSRPGHWNDPDMLEIGNGLSRNEERAQFSLWAEMASPLIAGNDLTKMTPFERKVLTNRAVIAVDQDRLGMQGTVVTGRASGRWVMSKPLAGGSRAVVLLNANGERATISTTAKSLGLRPAPHYRLENLWTGRTSTVGKAGRVSAPVGAHDAAMFKMTALNR